MRFSKERGREEARKRGSKEELAHVAGKARWSSARSLTPHHHRGERLIRNFGARVPRGNVLFGFPRATISFPPMQACQRRTIGGGGSGGGDGDRGWYARLRLHPLPLASPCLLFVVPHYPTHSLRMGLIPFSVCRDCTARGRYWGAYRSARGCTTHSLPPLSIYPFPLLFAYLPFCRSYVRIPSVSAFPVPSAQALHRPRSLFLFRIIRSPSILPSMERLEAHALWIRVT